MKTKAEKVRRWLFWFGGLSVRAGVVESHTGASRSTVNRVLVDLEKNGEAKRMMEGRSTRWQLMIDGDSIDG